MIDFNDNTEDRTQLGKHGKEDHRYMRSLSSAVVQRSPRHLMMVILIMALFVLAGLAWMSWAKIDVVIRGGGKVIPASQVQLVQSLEGGIVSEILVSEGQLVELGQPLVKISDIAFSSSFEENQLSYLELLARASRLKAEGFDEEYEPNLEVMEQQPQLNAAEKNLFESNKQQLADAQSILDEQIRQQRSALQEAQSKQRQLEKTLGLVRKEIKIKQPLKDRGIISEVEFLQLQQREAEIEGELEAVQLSIPRFRSTIEESGFKQQNELLNFRNQAKKELNEVNSEIARIRETQIALQDRVTRTELRSPVKGIVKRLYTNTIGGVVSPGSQVVDIVPQEDSLLIELEIKPADIASVSVGHSARLKFSAYDFALYGSLEGEVSFVSADTITDEEGKSFYLVRVKPAADFLGHESNPLYIKVGMTAEADIITSKKTILSYLMEPVNRGLDKALRER